MRKCPSTQAFWCSLEVGTEPRRQSCLGFFNQNVLWCPTSQGGTAARRGSQCPSVLLLTSLTANFSALLPQAHRGSHLHATHVPAASLAPWETRPPSPGPKYITLCVPAPDPHGGHRHPSVTSPLCELYIQQCWGSNLGPNADHANALPLSHTHPAPNEKYAFFLR